MFFLFVTMYVPVKATFLSLLQLISAFTGNEQLSVPLCRLIIIKAEVSIVSICLDLFNQTRQNVETVEMIVFAPALLDLLEDYSRPPPQYKIIKPLINPYTFSVNNIMRQLPVWLFLITAYYAIYLLGINSADKNIFLWIVAQAIKNRGTFSVSWKMWNHAANIKISEISVVLRRPCKIESISVIIKPAIFRVILEKRYNDW